MTTPITPQNNLTPTLNRSQLTQNIDALQKGGMANDQVQSYVNNYTKGIDGNYTLKGSTAPAKPQTSKPSFGQRISSDIQSAANNVNANYNAPVTGNNKFEQFGSVMKNATGMVGSAFNAVGSVASEVLPKTIRDQMAKSQTPEYQAEQQKKYGPGLAQLLGNTKFLQDFVTQHPDAAQTIENYASTAQNAGNISGTILGADATAGALNKVASAIPEVTSRVASAASDVASKVSDLPSTVKSKVSSMANTSAQSDWMKPTTKTAGIYAPAKEIAANAKGMGNDIGQRLVNNGVKLSDNISEGKYTTTDTAEKIRSDTNKMSHDMLRPSLVKADAAGAPRTPVDEVLSTAKDNIAKDKSLTQEVKDSLTEKLDTSAASLKKQYPNGMSLTDLHDEKIVRATNAKYNQFGDTAQTQEALKNKALADSSRTTLETKAPPEIPVHEFNQELTHQHQVADYLESLNNKKVPIGIGTKLIRAGAKGIGATIGSSLGIGGAFGGYSLGGILESAVENLPTTVRDSLLENLKSTNPEAFQKISTYLGTKQ